MNIFLEWWKADHFEFAATFVLFALGCVNYACERSMQIGFAILFTWGLILWRMWKTESAVHLEFERWVKKRDEKFLK